MPELAEVEHYRRVAHRVGAGRIVTKAMCAEDAIVVDGTTAAQVVGALEGRRIVDTCRHGKHMWLVTDGPECVTLHFGMTGMLLAPGAQPLALASGIDGGPLWPPRFLKLRLTFEDGGELAFTNARRLGRIRLRRDPRNELPISKLGFDPHLEMPSLDEFSRLVLRRKVMCKALLLDQAFAAGVGNWMADEVLYHARVAPRRRANSLTAAELKRMYVALMDVVVGAVAADARSGDYPAGWLFHVRWGKKPGARVNGETIAFDDIAGRTTAWVPALQR